MTTTLQSWGKSQGIRLLKALLKALELDAGASLELALTPKKRRHRRASGEKEGSGAWQALH